MWQGTSTCSMKNLSPCGQRQTTVTAVVILPQSWHSQTPMYERRSCSAQFRIQNEWFRPGQPLRTSSSECMWSPLPWRLREHSVSWQPAGTLSSWHPAISRLWVVSAVDGDRGRLEFLGYRRKRIRLMEKICLSLGYLYPFLALANVDVSWGMGQLHWVL